MYTYLGGHPVESPYVNCALDSSCRLSADSGAETKLLLKIICTFEIGFEQSNTYLILALFRHWMGGGVSERA